MTNKTFISANDFDLKVLFRTLFKFKYLILSSTLFFSSIALFVAIKTPNQYVAISKFVTKLPTQMGLKNLSLISDFIGTTNNTSDPSMYLDEIVNDRIFLESLILNKWIYKGDSLLLEDIYPIELPHNSEYLNEIKRQYIENLLRKVIIRITKNNANGVTSLLCTTIDQSLSFQINQFILNHLDSYFKEKALSQTKNNRIFLEERIKIVKKDLEKSENEYAKFKSTNRFIGTPYLALEEQQLLRNVNINQEIYLHLIKQYELAKIEETKEQPLLEIINVPEIPLKKIKPNRKLTVFVGLLSGLLIGILTSVFWYVMKNKHFKI